jgi:hypothetical protein
LPGPLLRTDLQAFFRAADPVLDVQVTSVSNSFSHNYTLAYHGFQATNSYNNFPSFPDVNVDKYGTGTDSWFFCRFN